MEDEKRDSGDSAEMSAKKEAGEENAATEGKTPEADEAGDAVQAPVSLQDLEAETKELKEKNLRLLAEMENLRQRTEREKAEFAKYAIAEFARDIVGVGDNVRRAIEAVPKDAVTPNSPIASLVEGVQVTERELLKVLERYQVTRFDPIGEQFNPHLHDAMTKVELPNVPADTVVQVIHAGYMIGERVLRPAAVIVAKGGVVEQPSSSSSSKSPASDAVIPPGAMKVPDDAISSLDVRSPAPRQEAPTVFGRQLGNEKRQSGAFEGASGQEAVAPFRRSHPTGGDGARAQQGAHSSSKAAKINRPIISPKSK
ncbi:MAG: nucleotide exchange factor GrpE [Alphaproteobacteria bacterium]